MTLDMRDTPADILVAIMGTGKVHKLSYDTTREALAAFRGFHLALGMIRKSPKYEAYVNYATTLRIKLDHKDVYVGNAEDMPQPKVKVEVLD